VALAERGSGRVRATAMHRVRADNLTRVIDEHVAHNATMMTDDYHLYKRAAETTGRKHFTTNHSSTNTYEGMFTARRLSPEHFYYVDAFIMSCSSMRTCPAR
jgi:hypothetical protein